MTVVHKVVQMFVPMMQVDPHPVHAVPHMLHDMEAAGGGA